MLPDLANLVLHDMVVVAQPLFGADGLVIVSSGFGEVEVRLVKTLRTLVEPRQKRPATPVFRQRMCFSDPRCMSFELTGSE